MLSKYFLDRTITEMYTNKLIYMTLFLFVTFAPLLCLLQDTLLQFCGSLPQNQVLHRPFPAPQKLCETLSSIRQSFDLSIWRWAELVKKCTTNFQGNTLGKSFLYFNCLGCFGEDHLYNKFLTNRVYNSNMLSFIIWYQNSQILQLYYLPLTYYYF